MNENKHWIPLLQETEKKDEARKYHSPQYDMATICIKEGAVSETKFWPNRKLRIRLTSNTLICFMTAVLS